MVLPGKHGFRVELAKSVQVASWKGTAEVWLSTEYVPAAQTVSIMTRYPIREESMPPSCFEPGALESQVPIGSGELHL